MQRNARQAKILEIVTSKEIETQEELCDELNKLNILATQATISRDIKELRLIKVAGSEKRYRYVYIGKGENGISLKMRNLFRDSVIGIRRAKNMIVVKTLSGNGSNAGMVIDKMSYPEILGSVAGDDTVLIICDTDDGAEKTVEKLNGFLN